MNRPMLMVLALLLVTNISATLTAAPVIGDTPGSIGAASSLSKTVYGFWPYWIDSESYQPDWSALTHVSYFCMDANSGGTLDTSHIGDDYYDVRDTGHLHNVKVTLTVKCFDQSIQDNILAYHRNDLASNILQKLQAYEADGVSIDFEGVRSTNSYTGGSNIVLMEQFMQVLRDTLINANPNYHISFCVMGSVEIVYRNAALSQYTDAVFLMGYDYHIAGYDADPSHEWAHYTGAVSPYDDPNQLDVIDSIEILDDYYSKDKVILGVPFYGYDWECESSSPRAERLPYDGIAVRMKDARANAQIYGRLWDSDSHTPWYSYQSTSTWHQCWYEDEESLGLKFDYVNSANIGGTGFWVLGYEGNNADIWDVVKAKMGPPASVALDLVFAIDSSGSMSWNDPGNLRLAGSKMLVNGLDPNIDRVGVVSWDDDIDSTYPLSTDLPGAKGAIDNVDSSGGTNLNVGLSKAIEVIDIGKRADTKHIIVFITNGHGTYTPAGAGGPAHDAGEKGYVIYAVGLAGEDVPVTSHLEDMAGATGGEWFVAYSAEDLLTILDYIGRQAGTTVHVEITPRSWDFNVLVVGCTAEKQLIISNAEEDKDVTITDIITPDYIEMDDGCWLDWWKIHLFCSAVPPIDLSPGQSKTFTFTLSSDSLAGIVDDNIVMKVKPKEGGEVETVAIPITGTVVSDPGVLTHYSEVASSLSHLFEYDEEAYMQSCDLVVEAFHDVLMGMVGAARKDYQDTVENTWLYAQKMRGAIETAYWRLTLLWAKGPPRNVDPDKYVDGFNSVSMDLSNAATALENAQAASDPDDIDAYLEQASDSFEAAIQKAAELDEYFKNDEGTLKGPYSVVHDFVDHLGNTIQGFSLLLMKEESLVIIADSPVDLIVENPLGEVISKTINEILGSKYLETDVDGDGEKEDLVIIYSRQPGVYLITPIPHEGTTPEETYSLGWISGDERGVVVEEQQVGDIPPEGFMLFANEAPSADAGPDQTVFAIPPATTAMVTLDGSGSYDPDGDPLTYNWTWDSNTASGVGPTVELPLGTTTISLVVNDGKVDSEPDTVDVTVLLRATIDFDPNTLNLKSKGKYVTAHIGLPPGFDVRQIDISSIRLNDTVPALAKPTAIGGHGRGRTHDLMVKFSRAAVKNLLTPGNQVRITITGEVDGIAFEGTDTIRVIDPTWYSLDISSIAGGSVTVPGEGTFSYKGGTVVSLVAIPDAGHHFVSWTGDVGTIANVTAASTIITVNDDYSIIANFEALPLQHKIAFTSRRDGNEEIYIMNVNGSNQINLTNHPAVDFHPTLSPDCTKIAFDSTRDGNEEIYVMNVDGTNPVRLTTNPLQDMDPEWSPDGTKIAFTSDSGNNYDIWVMNADGSNKTRITNDPAVDRYPTWSPDGGKIAFTTWRQSILNDAEIYVMNADGSNQTNLTNNPSNDQEVAWSPDGQKIAFSSTRDGNW